MGLAIQIFLKISLPLGLRVLAQIFFFNFISPHYKNCNVSKTNLNKRRSSIFLWFVFFTHLVCLMSWPEHKQVQCIVVLALAIDCTIVSVTHDCGHGCMMVAPDVAAVLVAKLKEVLVSII